VEGGEGKRNIIGNKKTGSCCALGALPFRIESVLESQWFEKPQRKITIALRRKENFIFESSNLGRMVQGWAHKMTPCKFITPIVVCLLQLTLCEFLRTL